jgi:hypothetical protein
MKTNRKLIDPRKRRVILAMDVDRRGDVEITKELILRCSELIMAIIDRQNTPGLHGHQKNYTICNAIAKLRISVDQASMVWSADNIDTFEKMVLRDMESIIKLKTRRYEHFTPPQHAHDGRPN